MGLSVGDEAPQYDDTDKDFAHGYRHGVGLEETCDVLGNLDGHRDAAYHEEGIAIIRHGDVKYQCNDETYEEKAVEQVAEFVSFHIRRIS